MAVRVDLCKITYLRLEALVWQSSHWSNSCYGEAEERRFALVLQTASARKLPGLSNLFSRTPHVAAFGVYMIMFSGAGPDFSTIWEAECVPILGRHEAHMPLF